MSGPDEGPDRKKRRLDVPQDGPYILRPVIQDVPLTTEEEVEDVHITAVEHWNNNLYIGTSASEILHFVAIPPEPNGDSDEPTYIIASRLQPTSTTNAATALGDQGVQQIVLLPAAGKACVLCNGVATFYSLPELSPAFGNTKVSNCRWIGGLDENQDFEDGNEQVIMIATASRIMLVRIGEEARRIRNIEFPGCLRSSRRDTIACVADNRSYSLLDVEHQQKIPLFSISSLEDMDTQNIGRIEELPLPPSSPLPTRTSSLALHGSPDGRGHERSTSLNVPRGDIGRLASPRPLSSDLSNLVVPDFQPPGHSRTDSRSPPRQSPPRSSTPDRGKALPPPPPPKIHPSLKPHILSPNPSEFLLTTGTGETEAGVGMFVNLDGDVVRGTIEFGSYPEALALDKPASNFGGADDSSQDLFVVAIINQSENGQPGRKSLEIHSLGENSEGGKPDMIGIGTNDIAPAGLHKTLTPFDQSFSDVVNSLRMVRLVYPGSTDPAPSKDTPDPRTESSLEQVEREKALFESQTPTTESLPVNWEAQRSKEEFEFVRTLARGQSRLVFWSGGDIWSLTQNPLAIQLDTKLAQAIRAEAGEASWWKIHSRLVIALMAQIRDREAKTESEFLSLGYIRQKASLMLFAHAQQEVTLKDREADLKLVESALIESSLDPRVIILAIPMLREDVISGAKGIWVHRGVALIAEQMLSTPGKEEDSPDMELLGLVRRYLASWQSKRGFGSISDEKHVFDSVDAALLHTLLLMDQELPQGSSAASSVRAKLNNIVDNWKGDFDRAVTLLERYHRLYVLSRLYQSRKLSRNVLATWKRIIEGEHDPSGELTPEAAEIRIRKYLVKLGNAQIVEEYGLLLAQRNPSLAIQVFTDDTSRVKFEPAKLANLLKEKAPGSVQQYLEYLVFNKNQPQYADDLIGYYLDSMLSVLETSEEARQSLADSYSTYRALSAPKPTYLTFITQNAPKESWWQSRLRLLQLLSGGSHYASSGSQSPSLTYSIPTVLARLAPFSQYLVSESIILDARQGHHSRAIDSLTHGLGDYDTAIKYCYFGGPPPATSQGPIDPSNIPDFSIQQSLFNHLLREFMKIKIAEDSLDRTSDLLSKFAMWFDPLDVLSFIPEDWPLEVLSEFFRRTLRKLRSERDESTVVRGLAAAENLRKQVEWAEGCEKLGAMFEDVAGVLRGSNDQNGDDDNSSADDDDTARSIAEVQEILRDDLVVS